MIEQKQPNAVSPLVKFFHRVAGELAEENRDVKEGESRFKMVHFGEIELRRYYVHTRLSEARDFEIRFNPNELIQTDVSATGEAWEISNGFLFDVHECAGELLAAIMETITFYASISGIRCIIGKFEKLKTTGGYDGEAVKEQLRQLGFVVSSYSSHLYSLSKMIEPVALPPALVGVEDIRYTKIGEAYCVLGIEPLDKDRYHYIVACGEQVIKANVELRGNHAVVYEIPELQAQGYELFATLIDWMVFDTVQAGFDSFTGIVFLSPHDEYIINALKTLKHVRYNTNELIQFTITL
jgi:hypothetical protein